jgi:hypothetical protein
MSSKDVLTHQAQSRPKIGKVMTIAVAAALIVVVTTMLRSRSSSTGLSAAAKPPLEELHPMAADLSLFRYFGRLSF